LSHWRGAAEVIDIILELLKLFQGHVHDVETHEWTVQIATHHVEWRRAHDVFDRVRRRSLKTEHANDSMRLCQYQFEEACLKSIYNESGYPAPFDARAAFWVVPRAIQFARAVGIPDTAVVEAIVGSNSNPID
jgi:hypothetical protein